MRVTLDGGHVYAPVRPPDGYTVHQYGPRWSAAMLAAHNAAFQDHWGFVSWTEDMWRQWVDESRNLRPALSWVAVHEESPEVVAGYVQSNEYEAYEAATGRSEAYLAKIGVRREHRGRGLASALLRHSLHHYQAAGFAESALDVDTNNPTGAYGLYERAGYRVDVRSATYQRTFAPLAVTASS
jgi:ribosomal protein S18 acetylase RimI-like enzyme